MERKAQTHLACSGFSVRLRAVRVPTVGPIDRVEGTFDPGPVVLRAQIEAGSRMSKKRSSSKCGMSTSVCCSQVYSTSQQFVTLNTQKLCCG